ncbi:hypothetical protein [Rubrivirga sp. IMCC43871]|uniref:hypothetical protein n=1 Tax=Rubrivirga sp. IMCC43871 TaxID=3391575 RepID=UPI00398FC980
MSERTYSEAEVAAIFARAAERQRPPSPSTFSTGLTLAEVEQAGREAGLDPSTVRAAAAEIDARERYPERSAVAVAERWVEAPLAAGAWDDLVASLRHRFGASTAWWGTDTGTVGTAQEWTHTAGSGTRTTVTLSPREGQTLLRVVQEGAGLGDDRTMGWLVAAVVALVPAMLAGALVAETLALGDLMGIATVLLVLIPSVAIGGPWVASRVRAGRSRQAETVQTLADDLADQLVRGRQPSVEPAPVEAPGPLLDLSAFDESDTEADGRSERRRERS